jgi:hypothetical protein
MKLTRIAAALVAAALAAGTVLAQAPADDQGSKFGLGLAGGYYSLGGDDFETTDAGYGFEVSGHFHLSPKIALLGGFGMNWNDDSFIDETITTMRISVEPRYLFHMEGGKLTPFLGARVGYLSAGATVQDVDFSQTGFYFAGTGGVLVRMSPAMMFEAGVQFGQASFGDAEADGQTIDDSDASGSFLALQLGIVYHFGKK